MGEDMQRREFIKLIGGAVTAWPLAAHAQRREKPRRVGVLTPFPADDAEMQARNAALAYRQGRRASVPSADRRRFAQAVFIFTLYLS